MKKLYTIATFGLLLIAGCGIYSFSGSTLPNHLKTVEIPVFANSTLEPGVADEVTSELNKEILNSQLRPANENADATISGTVSSYSNDPYTFGAGETQSSQVNVEQYKVRVSAQVEFFDNKQNKSIYKGTVTGEGIYSFQTETETDGRKKAIKDLVQRIMQNSVQSW